MNPSHTHSQNNIEIQMNDQTAQGAYSNLAIINHAQAEFIMDFIFMQPNSNKGKGLSRIIMSPQNAKKFYLALRENIQKYENQYKPID